ncbi:MAG: hypothetical protein FD180_444 [Planctomycetota bacterium]|nr:MAG: hypothetical protein FD180_444 [Planctomycetota bacterium]
MPQSAKAVVRQWFDEVWNRKDAAAIDRLASPQCVVHGLPEGGAGGIAGFRAFHQAFVSAYPDMQVAIEDLIEEGDRVAWRITFRGTHSGPGLGIAATGLQGQLGVRG